MTYNLQKLLIVLGVIVIPFYEIIFRTIPFVHVIAPDTRMPKSSIAIVIALSIGLLAIFEGGLKRFDNKWLLLLVGYLLLNLFMAPVVDLQINGIEVGDFYFWKPFCQILCLMLMVFAISNIEYGVLNILRIMVICGSVMAGYVILQKLGFDQFWIVKFDAVGYVTEPNIGGNLGQPTIVASFLAMLVPIAILIRRYLLAVLICISVVITRSDMAIISLFVFLFFSIYIWKNTNKRLMKIILFGTILIASLSYFSINKFHNYVDGKANGRVLVWNNVYKDIKDGDGKQDYSFTGYGLGRFPFIFPEKHKSPFFQAHNDVLELTYNCGLVSLFLFIMALIFMIRNSSNFLLLMSFIVLLICSLGSFPFQLAAHQFYAAIIIGLLHNKKLTEVLK